MPKQQPESESGFAVEETTIGAIHDAMKDGAVTANTGVNTGKTRTRVEKPSTAPIQLWELVHEALAIDLPEGGPPESAFTANEPVADTGPIVDPTTPGKTAPGCENST